MDVNDFRFEGAVKPELTGEKGRAGAVVQTAQTRKELPTDSQRMAVGRFIVD